MEPQGQNASIEDIERALLSFWDKWAITPNCFYVPQFTFKAFCRTMRRKTGKRKPGLTTSMRRHRRRQAWLSVY